MIQFNAAASPRCAVNIACKNALPHASSVSPHSSLSSAASVVSLYSRSNASNLCLSGGASPLSANAPAALVPPFNFPASDPAFALGAHSLPDTTLKNFRATGETRGSYAASTAALESDSPIAANAGANVSSVSAVGSFPTRAATHPSARSATRLPNSDLHSVKKSVGAAVTPRTYVARSSSTHASRSFSTTREQRASIDSAISCPRASSSALPARIVRSSTASGVSGSTATRASISWK